MAGKSTKSKEFSKIAKFYLKAYNFVQVLGWMYILYHLIYFYTFYKNSENVWLNVKLCVIIFQTAAALEILHATSGLVPSNPVLTFFQVLSRLVIVYGVILATPINYAPSSIGLPMALFAWSITEIIRYLYYFLNSVGFVPSLIVWARYTFFIALYPIGISGELLCCYAAHRYAVINQEAWSYQLPNTWNFTFSYQYFIIFYMLLYIPFFPQLYLHMFSQRRKILGKSEKTHKIH